MYIFICQKKEIQDVYANKLYTFLREKVIFRNERSNMHTKNYASSKLFIGKYSIEGRIKYKYIFFVTYLPSLIS